MYSIFSPLHTSPPDSFSTLRTIFMQKLTLSFRALGNRIILATLMLWRCFHSNHVSEVACPDRDCETVPYFWNLHDCYDEKSFIPLRKFTLLLVHLSIEEYIHDIVLADGVKIFSYSILTFKWNKNKSIQCL